MWSYRSVRSDRLTRLLIADANLLVRAGIKALLMEAFAIAAVGEAACGAEVLASLRQQPWTLCVLDVSLPERGGLEIARYVRKLRCRTQLLFISSRLESQYAAGALKE